MINNQLEGVRLLIEQGADVNSEKNKQRTSFDVCFKNESQTNRRAAYQ
jgi:hypothetical protein